MKPEDQVIHCGNRRVTGTALREQAARAATGFASLGLRQGDTVAVMLRNDIPYLVLMLALGRLGVHLVAVNWHFRREEAEHVLTDCGARVLVVHADLWPGLAPVVPAGMTVIVVPTPSELLASYGAEPARVPLGAHDWLSWVDSFAPHAEAPLPAVGSMLYTSGTTGKPKAVMRLPGTPRQHEGAARIRSHASQAAEGMRTAIVAPLYHAGPNAAARVALELAAVIVVLPRFDAEELLVAIATHRLTHLSMVPIMFVRLLKLPPEVRARHAVQSLRNVTHGGAPCAPDVKRAMLEWWGPIVSETYGSTEAGLVTFARAEEWLAKPGTVGRPFPGTRIRVLDEAGRELRAGEVGEIVVDPGENALPFTYRNNPEARAAVDRDGFIANGDVGYLDEEGFLFVTDRRRDMIISGGVNIYPAEIEHVLLASPEVADCAVFGIPDAEYGEAVAAAVVPAAGATPTAEGLRAWVRERLAGYKVPQVVELRDSLPREGMGKVFKQQLRAPYWERAGRRI
ncbi:AMP-binding protein [Caenimonas sedimenti]|uniref:AMP-binding protein n=1 Tax=Caenimonas sedimenti TaxID=2596921 RepID=A0A562ZJG0_9BURK|nr:AMP-binding protein [Caenimonas sedimenti]TWO68476.1 AMP-binding protein [Caenimonas sedimenti]